MPRVVWRGNRLDLKPEWIVNEVRIHTVKGYTMLDGTKRDTMVVYFAITPEQLTKLWDDFGKKNIPTNILGLNVIPLIPGTVLWRYEMPEYKIKEEYTAFEIHPDKAPDPTQS